MQQLYSPSVNLSVHDLTLKIIACTDQPVIEKEVGENRITTSTAQTNYLFDINTSQVNTNIKGPLRRFFINYRLTGKAR